MNVYNVEDRFHLVDLPGYGYARASKAARRDFRRLLDGYLSRTREIAGVVWLLDVRRDPTEEDRVTGDLLAGAGIPVLAAITKADKFGRSRRVERARSIRSTLDLQQEQCIVTSVRTREGIEELREAVERLVGTRVSK